MLLWLVSFFKNFQVNGKNLAQNDPFFIFLLKNTVRKKGLWVPINRKMNEAKTQRAGVLTAAWNRMIKKMLQLILWSWLCLRICSRCSIKHLHPYGKHFYGDGCLIFKLLKRPLLVFVLPCLITLAFGAALYQKCPAKCLRCFVISDSDSPLSSFSVYL